MLSELKQFFKCTRSLNMIFFHFSLALARLLAHSLLCVRALRRGFWFGFSCFSCLNDSSSQMILIATVIVILDWLYTLLWEPCERRKEMQKSRNVVKSHHKQRHRTQGERKKNNRINNNVLNETINKWKVHNHLLECWNKPHTLNERVEHNILAGA